MDLKKELRIIVKYILPPEDRDNDVIENYVDTLTLINEEYVKQLSIPRVSNWVACKDALPKHETDVICYCLDFEVRVGRKTGGFWFIDGYSLPQDITHWQELPKPPYL